MTKGLFSTADLYDSAPDRYRMCDLPFRHFGGVRHVAGPCVTVIASDNPSTVGGILSEPGEGRVLFVDGRAFPSSAYLGDVLGTRAFENGWAGAIVAGAIRDSATLAKLPLAVVALRTTAIRSFGSGKGAVRDALLTLGGVEVRTGDLVYSDEDAVLVASRDARGAGGSS